MAQAPGGGSWRMDETYIKVGGEWKYLYRAVDKEGATVDFLLRAKRDKAAATAYFKKAMWQNGELEKVTMDKDEARTLLCSIYKTEADLVPDYNKTLTVRLHHLAQQ